MSYYVKKKRSQYIVVKITDAGAHHNCKKFRNSGAAHRYKELMEAKPND